MKDLNTENYRTLMKNTKDDTSKWEKNPMFIKILLKCLYYPKPSIDSMQLLSKFQCHFSTEVWCHIKRNTDQWNRIKRPETNSHVYNQRILDKGAKNTKWGKDSLFNKWWWENWITTCRRWNWTHILHHSQKLTQNRLKT